MSAFDPPPEDEVDVDREIRIEKMKRELDDLADGSMISGAVGEIRPDLEEAFLTRVLEFEKADYDTNFNRLIERGVEMVPPAELDDANLEVLCALAVIHCFLNDTDHLSDRELYQWLWTDGLREEAPDVAQLGGAWHTSPIGSGNEEDTAIFLKYYASEKERRNWTEQFPIDPLPPKSPLPYDRDRNLPRSPEPR